MLQGEMPSNHRDESRTKSPRSQQRKSADEQRAKSEERNSAHHSSDPTIKYRRAKSEERSSSHHSSDPTIKYRSRSRDKPKEGRAKSEERNSSHHGEAKPKRRTRSRDQATESRSKHVQRHYSTESESIHEPMELKHNLAPGESEENELSGSRLTEVKEFLDEMAMSDTLPVGLLAASSRFEVKPHLISEPMYETARIPLPLVFG